MLDHMRAHAARSMQGLQPLELHALEEAVETLQAYVDAFSMQENRVSNAKKSGDELIAAVSAAQSVRNRSKMRDLQESLLTKFVPTELVEAVQQAIKKVVSGSTISKAQAEQLAIPLCRFDLLSICNLVRHINSET